MNLEKKPSLKLSESSKWFILLILSVSIFFFIQKSLIAGISAGLIIIALRAFIGILNSRD